MAEATSDHSDSKHTVDDLFQYLVRACDIPPARAKKEIREKLQLDKLQVDLHIRGGARKLLPMRPATEEELQDKESAGVVMFHLYEFAPPEGITEPVHFQDWDAGSVFRLTIRDEHLIIDPDRLLDYPWDAYSFTIANWPLVEELWPNPNRARSDLSAPASKPEDPPAPQPTPVSAAAHLAPESSVITSEFGSKTRRSDWIEGYLTKEKKDELAKKYNQIGKAAEAVHRDMVADSKVNPYKNPRNIEPFLTEANLYPRRKLPK